MTDAACDRIKIRCRIAAVELISRWRSRGENFRGRRTHVCVGVAARRWRSCRCNISSNSLLLLCREMARRNDLAIELFDSFNKEIFIFKTNLFIIY